MVMYVFDNSAGGIKGRSSLAVPSSMRRTAGDRMYKVGDAAEMTKVISEEDVFLFAGITGDRNPIHISEEYAPKTRFGERIAHGSLTAGLISAVIGQRQLGDGSHGSPPCDIMVSCLSRRMGRTRLVI